MMMLGVSCLIPTFRGWSLLEKHLPAVVAALRDDDQLIIIDDASGDDTIKNLRQWFGCSAIKPTSQTIDAIKVTKWQTDYRYRNKQLSVTLLQPEHNVRFAQAVNIAATQAHHPLLFLLNNDVSPRPDCLRWLVAYFETPQSTPTGDTDPELFFGVGCLEVASHANGNVGLAGKNELWFARGLWQHQAAATFETGPTAWISGGSGLFSKKKWQDLHGFDLAYYPAYWEDIDLSFRARERGWQVWFESRAKVEHHHESTNDSTFGQARIAAISWRNAYRFLWRHANWWQRLMAVLWWPYWWWRRHS